MDKLDPKLFSTARAFNRARFEVIDRGDLLFPWHLAPCRQKILIVVDGTNNSFLNVTFGQLYFSLSTVVETLKNNPEWWAKFDITKAHRQNDPLGEADINGFRFTQPGFDINQYHQVWFFGARSNPNDTQRLSDDELAIVSRWMDEQQGGVFATGDHADLGVSLCGRIPRVKSMRKWSFADGVPSPTGLNRHDTLRKGHNAVYTFNDESDDIPMNTDVTRFPVPSWSPFQLRSMPHPVLCGTDGVIDILPDHPHEGEVVEPAVLTNTFTFPGYANKPEYPMVAGLREKPYIIARARVQSDHTATSDTNKGAANGKTFGAIGAYDGHKANVGRVVVDSTWHHWFDVNLVGRPLAPGADPIDPVTAADPKSQGFLATAAGQAALARIKNYFRNVALWVSPPAKQNCMFMRATWGIFVRYPLAEQLSSRLPIWELGGYARDAIGRRASQCTLTEWLLPHIPVKVIDQFRIPKPDPCLTCPPWDVIEIYALGGVMRELLALSEKLLPKDEMLQETQVATAMATGLNSGLAELSNTLQRSIRHTQATFKELAPLMKIDINAERFGAPKKTAQQTPKRKRK